jgi:hypothetical protein
MKKCSNIFQTDLKVATELSSIPSNENPENVFNLTQDFTPVESQLKSFETKPIRMKMADMNVGAYDPRQNVTFD